MIFPKNEELKLLEQNSEWANAIKLLKDNFLQNPENANENLRLISECWYVLSEWEFLNTNKGNLDYNNVRADLVNAYGSILENTNMNANEMAILGYMITLNPDLFSIETNDDEYINLEIQGKKLLEKACKTEPNNLFAQTLYLGNCGSEKKYNKAKEQLSSNLTELLPNDSAIETYFKEVLYTSSEKSF